MRYWMMILGVVATLGLSVGCEREPQTPGEAIEKAAEKTEDAAKDAAHETEKAADDVKDAVKDATN